MRKIILSLWWLSFAVLALAQDAPTAAAPAAKEVKTDKIQSRLEELTRELNLTPGQQVRIKEVLSRAKDEVKAVLEDSRAKIKEIRIRCHDEISALLSTEQQQKFQQTRGQHESVPEVKE